MQSSNESGYTPPVTSPRVDALLFETSDLVSAKLLISKIKEKCGHLRPWPLITKKEETVYEISIMNAKGGKPTDAELSVYHEVVAGVLEELTAPVHINPESN